MTYAVVIVSILIFIGIIVFFIKSYTNQGLSPEKVEALKSEMTESFMKNGLKAEYDTMDDVPLMDVYVGLKQEEIDKKQVIKIVERAVKLDMIMSIFDERGIDPIRKEEE